MARDFPIGELIREKWVEQIKDQPVEERAIPDIKARDPEEVLVTKLKKDKSPKKVKVNHPSSLNRKERGKKRRR